MLEQVFIIFCKIEDVQWNYLLKYLQTLRMMLRKVVKVERADKALFETQTRTPTLVEKVLPFAEVLAYEVLAASRTLRMISPLLQMYVKSLGRRFPKKKY